MSDQHAYIRPIGKPETLEVGIAKSPILDRRPLDFIHYVGINEKPESKPLRALIESVYATQVAGKIPLEAQIQILDNLEVIVSDINKLLQEERYVNQRGALSIIQCYALARYSSYPLLEQRANELAKFAAGRQQKQLIKMSEKAGKAKEAYGNNPIWLQHVAAFFDKRTVHQLAKTAANEALENIAWVVRIKEVKSLDDLPSDEPYAIKADFVDAMFAQYRKYDSLQKVGVGMLPNFTFERLFGSSLSTTKEDRKSIAGIAEKHHEIPDFDYGQLMGSFAKDIRYRELSELKGITEASLTEQQTEMYAGLLNIYQMLLQARRHKLTKEQNFALVKLAVEDSKFILMQKHHLLKSSIDSLPANRLIEVIQGIIAGLPAKE